MPDSTRIASVASAGSASIASDALTGSVALQLTAAFVFGVLLLAATGFVPIEAVHNAAHDSRHALAFPCH